VPRLPARARALVDVPAHRHRGPHAPQQLRRGCASAAQVQCSATTHTCASSALASRSKSSQPTCSCLRGTKSPWPAAGPCVNTTSTPAGHAAHLAAMSRPRRTLNAPQKRGCQGAPHTRKPPRAVVAALSRR
jgi:hypothetical protein